MEKIKAVLSKQEVKEFRKRTSRCLALFPSSSFFTLPHFFLINPSLFFFVLSALAVVTRFDSGEFKRDELVRRVQAVFCPNSKGASRVEWGERGRVWRMFEEHINIRKWE